jgi:hypothetical protein
LQRRALTTKNTKYTKSREDFIMAGRPSGRFKIEEKSLNHEKHEIHEKQRRFYYGWQTWRKI